MRISHIKVVPTGMPVRAAVGHLHERADALGDATAVEGADLIDRQIVVGRKVRGRWIYLVFCGVSKSTLHHQRERRNGRANITPYIAVELELPAVGSERRTI